MGTNYYWIKDPCPHCGHGKEKAHIGKSSYGWTFSFHGIDDVVKSYKEWLNIFENENGIIKDEYGEVKSVEYFKDLVESKRNAKMNHTIYAKEKHPEHYKRDCWLDDEGNSFSRGYFR